MIDSAATKHVKIAGAELPKKIRVVAPSNLPAGYELTVETETNPPISFQAFVPPGGVKQGEVFLTLPPDNYQNTAPDIRAPTGGWKDGLCDCFNHGICSAQLWCAMCCSGIFLGQVMQRMRLTFLGGLTSKYAVLTTFKTVVILVICYNFYQVVLQTVIAPYINEDGQVDANAGSGVYAALMMKNVGVLVFLCWYLYALCRTRQNVRRTYSIPEDSCNGCEDAVCALFCGCCTVTQIARHTGEYETYPSVCCSSTGLPDHAPQIV
jgi:Cys-rich protein (TIGR01571 family)